MALILICISAGVVAARGAETNGAVLRPFYIVGHNADTLSDVKAYLDWGANALEMDVDIFPGHSNELCIAHGPDLGIGPGKTNSPPLADYLKALHVLARTHTNLCLIIFDCKPLTTTPEGGAILLDDIRRYLVGAGDDRIDLNTLISVGKIREKAMFSKIAGELGPHEGLIVDGEPNPAKVSAFFTSLNVQNRAYSDGVGFFSTCLGHFQIWFSVKKACRLRDEDHRFRLVLTWTIDDPYLMTKFIKAGVDGILADWKFHPYNFSWANLGNGVRSLRRIVREKGTALGIRLANRDDNPFSIRDASTGGREDGASGSSKGFFENQAMTRGIIVTQCACQRIHHQK